ncbi:MULTISPECIES: hypothetical protein [unclassified Paenibacillus]|uniref:hypothetical protein n=1 Tax=unclassified Paenibacillus TaxID=185978 RepID=UPI000AE435F1|nr:hypothetical protein [Paenibacillus sp. FSL H8-0259]
MNYLRHTDGYVAFGVENPSHLFVRMGHVLQDFCNFTLHLHVSFAQTPCYSICGISRDGAGEAPQVMEVRVSQDS